MEAHAAPSILSRTPPSESCSNNNKFLNLVPSGFDFSGYVIKLLGLILIKFIIWVYSSFLVHCVIHYTFMITHFCMSIFEFGFILRTIFF